MQSDLMKKISISIILVLMLTSIIVGDSLQNMSQIVNLSNDSSGQNNSLLIPLDNLTNASGTNFNSTINSSLQDLNKTNLSENNPVSTNQENYIPLASEIIPSDSNPCASSDNLMNVMLVQDNKIEVKAQLPSSCDINNIQKQDIIQNTTSKEVIVSSSVHVDSPLTVYTDISPIDPTQTNSVRIFWVNENTTISPSGFYDTNGDGKYDRISWIVPHLSTQIFQVNVNLNNTGSSPSILLNVAAPTNDSTASNPINFSVNVNYLNYANLNCNLTIYNGTYQNLYQNLPLPIISGFGSTNMNLPDGPYNWSVGCSDTSNTSINNNVGGHFFVNQGYSVGSPDSVYLISSNNNLIGSGNTQIQVNSTNPSIKNISLYLGNILIHNELTTNSTISYFNLIPFLNQTGNYQLNVSFLGLVYPVPIIQSFSVAQANLTYNNPGSNTNIYANIALPSGNILKGIILFFGDNSVNNSYFQSSFSNSFSQTFNHDYANIQNYPLELDFTINDRPFSISIPISIIGNSIPSVILRNPANNQLINDTSTPVFSYSVSGSSISNCTFYLWNGTTGSPTTPYTQLITNPSTVSINYVNSPYSLAGGNYGWDVTCTNSTGYLTDAVPSGGYYFTIIGGAPGSYSYPQQGMVQDARDALDNFTSLEASYSLEQMEAMSDLGITNNLTYYSKRLAQIDQDLGVNINYITDLNKKNQTVLSETNEIQNIRSNIPDSIDVSSSTEFVKNSLTTGMDKIVKAYADNNHMSLNNYELNRVSQMNYNIQKYISVDTQVKQVSLSYLGQISSITLVSKQVNISNSSLTNIIEVIPSDLGSDIVFLTKATPIGNSMYLISSEDPSFVQNGGKIIYYFTTPLNNPEDMKKSDTILFEDFSVSRSGITGFVIDNLTGGISFWYYPLLIAILFVFVYAGKRTASKIQLSKWKKEENVNRIMENIEKAKKALKDEDNVEDAKEAYHRIRELFALVPSGFKKHAIEEIEKIRRGIDRRDIIGFVKEYEKAKLQGRQEDARSLYSEIKRTYKRLPKKDQERVYHKMFKEKWEI